jgi:hypothetical protein
MHYTFAVIAESLEILEVITVLSTEELSYVILDPLLS